MQQPPPSNEISDWKNKKVAVVGYGVEGVSTAAYLHKKGISVSILDINKESEIDQHLLTDAKKHGSKFVLGENYLKDLSRFDVIIASPGIKRSTKEFAHAEEKGSLITSQTKLFFDYCPAPIIGVTGTKGKGTTASLIYEMLKAEGFDAYIGGNVGVPPLEFLEKLTDKSWVVLELSSFQLMDLTKSPADAEAMAGKPHIAVMLMVTSEHLDFHKNPAEYIDAKRNILRFQTPSDFAVLNRDYVATNESDIFTDGKAYFVSRKEEADQGCFKRDKSIWVRIGDSEKKIIDTKDILLPGSHNLENVCASVMASVLAGVSKEEIVKVLKTFKGLTHRLELVGEVNGVRYYDDSFSTIPETAIAAIEAFKEPEILILGGSGKQSDFKELGEVISKAKNIKAIIGIGSEWARIKEELQSHDTDVLLIEGAGDMKTIVKAAEKIARPGDVVLLSPACASFDMFKNYKDRGEQFKKEVRAL